MNSGVPARVLGDQDAVAGAVDDLGDRRLAHLEHAIGTVVVAAGTA